METNEDVEAEDTPASSLAPAKAAGLGNLITVSPAAGLCDEADNSSAACGKRFASSLSFEGRFMCNSFGLNTLKIAYGASENAEIE